MVKKLPNVGKEWEKRDEGSVQRYSWVNFEKTDNDDVLSFCAWKVNSKVALESSPVNQSSIEMFRSNGRARMSTSERGEQIADLVRHQIVEVLLSGVETRETVEAIEYSYVYGNDTAEPISMCHGYFINIDDTIVAVQHTSRRPIASELAFDMISEILLTHYKVAAYSRGEVRKIELK